ncbi:serine threonine protein kinase : Serine/threonine protein kinase OS=Planctomyces maris DSM 8797 GN=PM8797T_27372 PE=4 SV=1: Pkinase: WD40: WD40: WD40: WD40: WD40 [Gemmata massiliana]|uniref:non-specific serine/threonine protein kinase n=1 Tax=Gemmata massiliana TaxID=1210884 RepID=A0A6P2CZ58_9BACT|nr:serine/threonine-protein kinase [Gemmata massiliana]VTR92442.1 serine threonine protein kinase : Serine/threonine protein kinase OS=Planctomyces maris DSM 8797 GN=PM8797T_27372 PE=4 SV=1: Pkinase: WD40: WD40: WD40: WD40: WD40 [Gemmata massiliana]
MPAEANAAKDVFLAALEKDTPAERAAYLETACAGDAGLRRRVEAMLRAHDRPDPLLDRPAVEHLSGAGDTVPLDFLGPTSRPGALGRLGHYEVLEVAGWGGMGIVLRAFDEKLHRVVAVKVLAPAFAGSASARRRFVREARAAAAVTHENVIGIHAVEDAGPVPYLVMQFVEGKTLQQKIDRTGALPLREALRIGVQIAEGLAAAHKHGLVHRDIKPANILLENGIERVKITDFGLARAGDDASTTGPGIIAGTPAYMSPEQAAGEKVDHRSDLFSLGSVLYAMATGHGPFTGGSMAAVFQRLLAEKPPPIRESAPATPDWLEAITTRLLAKNPADRFQTAAEVAVTLGRRLAEVQSGPGSSVTVAETDVFGPAQALERARASGKRPWLRWAALAGLLVATAATAWIAAKNGSGGRDTTKGDGPVPQQPATAVPPSLTGPVTLRPKHALKGHTAGVRALAFSPDGTLLASGGADHLIYLWDTVSWAHRGPLKGHPGEVSALAFAPGGGRLASVTSGEDDFRVRIWNVATAVREAELGKRATSGMWDVAYSPNGRTLICGGWDKKLYLVDAATGDERVLVGEAAPEFVRGLSISPDGRWVAAGGSGETKVWDVTTGVPVATAAKLPDGMCPTFLPDSGFVGWNHGEGRVYLCAPSGQERKHWRSPKGHIDGLTVSADGRFVAAIGENGLARVFSAADLTEVATLDGHQGTVWAAAFAPDGTKLATGGEVDQTIYIWDLPEVCHVRK